jgi:hypothetical protein
MNDSFIVVTRIYVKAEDAKQARDIVRYELGSGHANKSFINWPYNIGMVQFDCDCEEVVTLKEFAEKASEK